MGPVRGASDGQGRGETCDLDRGLVARRHRRGHGHGNARSLGRLQSAVACGGEVDGVRRLSPRTIDRIFEVQSHGIDLVIGIPSKWGLGYGLFPEGRGRAFGGYGGSLVVIDADRRMTFAYVRNKMRRAAEPSPRRWPSGCPTS